MGFGVEFLVLSVCVRFARDAFDFRNPMRLLHKRSKANNS